VTTTLRQPEFPAASYARIVTTFVPTSSGIDADQLVVPLAVPDCPVFVDHLTDVTPTLSLAVPLNAIDVAAVETDVAPGDPIVSVGAVVSVPVPPPPVGATAACLVTVTTCDTRLVPAVAVTVIVFEPIASAIFEMLHADAVPDAAMDDEPDDHVTEIVPDPPDAAPDKLTVVAVVVAEVAFTVSVNGPTVGEVGFVGGVGVTGGAGVPAPVCAAYKVWIAATSPAASPETIL
jgi:hypothetical protein